MYFKHLAAKAKKSLFLILFVIIGFGVFIMLNTDDGQRSNGDKDASKSKPSGTVKDNTKKSDDNSDIKPDDKKNDKSDNKTDNKSNEKPSTTNTRKPDFGTVDGGEYNNNFYGRVEVYENPFFGMKVNFPEGWTMLDKHDQLGYLLESFDESKYYLFTAVNLDKQLDLGVKAEKYPDGAVKYLEEIKAATKYYTENFIGINVPQQTQKESIQTEISEVTINNTKLYQFSVTQWESRSESYFICPWKNGIIIFKIVCSADANGLQMLTELLKGTTFSKPLSSQIEMP